MDAKALDEDVEDLEMPNVAKSSVVKSSPLTITNTRTAGDVAGEVLGTNNGRSPSPGVAKQLPTSLPESNLQDTLLEPNASIERLVNNPRPANEHVIEEMTQKLAGSLLDSSSSNAKTEYISINQKLEEKRKQELAQELVKTGAMLAQSKQLQEITLVHSSSSYNQLNDAPSSNDTTINFLVSGNTKDVALEASSLAAVDSLAFNASCSFVEVDTPNIRKSVLNTNGPLGSHTVWENSNGSTAALDTATGKESPSEVDILTAMSGEPLPNTLPNVTDGISDGEISLDSDDDDDGEVDHLVAFVKVGC